MWCKGDLFLISEFQPKTHWYLFKNIHLTLLSAKWFSFYIGLCNKPRCHLLDEYQLATDRNKGWHNCDQDETILMIKQPPMNILIGLLKIYNIEWKMEIKLDWKLTFVIIKSFCKEYHNLTFEALWSSTHRLALMKVITMEGWQVVFYWFFGHH